MKFRKSLSFFLSFIFFGFVPILASCSSINNYSQKGRIYSSQINSNFKWVDLSGITFNQLQGLPALHDLSRTRMAIGGFLEIRKFYSKTNSLHVHLGLDMMTDSGETVYSPYDGEIIKSLYIPNKNHFENFGDAHLGGVIIMKVKLSDMNNLSEEEILWLKKKIGNLDFVYFQFLHLSKETIYFNNSLPVKETIGQSGIRFFSSSNVSPENPVFIKQGKKIGVVGEFGENGGWSPHVHLQTFFAASDYFSKREWAPGTAITTDPSKISNLSFVKSAIDPNFFLKFHYDENKKFFVE